jgi:hypothetical protein
MRVVKEARRTVVTVGVSSTAHVYQVQLPEFIVFDGRSTVGFLNIGLLYALSALLFV